MLTSTGDAAYYFKRQVLTTAVGVVAAIILAKTDYHLWSQHLLLVIWAIAIALLLFTAATGVATKGAVRWIEIAGISIQPSEFSKIVVVLAAANIAQHFFEEHDYSSSKMLLYLAFGVVLPLGLILIQPDKGTTIILVVTLLVMAYLAGVPLRYIMLVLGLGGAFLLVLILGDDYSRSRVLTALNPQADPYGAGYQLNRTGSLRLWKWRTLWRGHRPFSSEIFLSARGRTMILFLQLLVRNVDSWEPSLLLDCLRCLSGRACALHAMHPILSGASYCCGVHNAHWLPIFGKCLRHIGHYSYDRQTFAVYLIWWIFNNELFDARGLHNIGIPGE